MVQHVGNFYGQVTHTLDEKARVSIPARYRDIVIYRNASGIAHGLLDGSFKIGKDGILHERELVFTFDTVLKKVPSMSSTDYLEKLLDLAEIDNKLILGVTLDDEVRLYALSDWVKTRDKDNIFRYRNEAKIDSSGRIQLDRFMQLRFKPHDQVIFHGREKYFIMCHVPPEMPKRD